MSGNDDDDDDDDHDDDHDDHDDHGDDNDDDDDVHNLCQRPRLPHPRHCHALLRPQEQKLSPKGL